ncbi:ABC transporter permease [Pseudonocardia acaciae]|uniref:ABC transporter permease n=1 Tax=Pseudonocardia acaciae TaxID=551276 RepID=UPI0004901A19|nr:ABC transporter permease [Pseudonocardia acaciae]
MSLREAVVSALRSLRGNRLRSMLTAVGIVIGVAAVITLVALGNGVKADFDQRFSRLANQITVTKVAREVPGAGQARELTDADVAALRDRRRVPHIASVTPMSTGSAVLTANQRHASAGLIGTTADYPAAVGRSVVAGAWFDAAQERGNAKVVVLGPGTVAALWGPDADLDRVLGASVRVGRVPFTVIGVAAGDGQRDNAVLMPIGAARTFLKKGDDAIGQIIVQATEVAAVPVAIDELTAVLDDRHRTRDPAKRDFDVMDLRSMLEQGGEFLSLLTAFVAAVAAISLIVGGIGVANIMLVTVTERTREIGIRKAVGAPRPAILRQFLIEAVTLTGLGGLAGVVLGLGLAYGGRLVLPMLVPGFPAPIPTVLPAVAAFGVSLVIGLMSGLYPANRAALLRPIEALRFE